MTDCFAVFGLPRRPALAAETLKEKYLQLAALSHPDSGGGHEEKFRILQEAYKTLLDPAKRLRYLLELQFGSVEKKSLPPHQELFLKVGGALQQARTLQQRLEKSQTSLTRALLAQDREPVLRKIREALQSVQEVRRARDGELIALDAHWPAVSAEELADLASGLTFLSRWQSELAETEFRLTHAET